jgi:DNA-directed RNA polymerase subunit RPC12/RpoP
MIAVDGAYDELNEDVAANVPLPNSAGVFDYYVHSWDANMVYNDSASPVSITIIDDVGPGITGLQLNGQSAPSVQAGTPILVDAIVDDSGGRGDTSIQGANYTIDGDWATSTPLFPADGTFDTASEAVIVTINTNGWTDATYQICVYGWDDSPNYNATGACDSFSVYSVDDQPPDISNVRLDGSATLTVAPGDIVNLTASVIDSGAMTSNILSANYSVDHAWPGTDMYPTDGAFDSIDEDIYVMIDTTGWSDATYQICVHGADDMPNYYTGFSSCADLTIQTPPDSESPTIQNATADPSVQTPDDLVRISVNVFDNSQVNSVSIQVSDPEGIVMGNYTMNFDSFNSEYYSSHSFSDTGTYDYTIWASDQSGNWNSVSGDFRIAALASPSFLDDFWWLIIIVVTAILVGLMMVWKTRPSETEEPGEESQSEKSKSGPSDSGKGHVHEFAMGHDAEHESVVKCLTCGDTVLLVGDTDLLRTRCDHCGSTLLENATGLNYLIVDEDPGVAFQGFKSILKKEVPGLCISTTFPEKLGRRYDVDGADLYWLTDTATETGVKTLDPKRLDFEMMRAISHFLKEHPEGAVMIDGIENLIVENGFDDVFRFIKKINDLASVGGATIFVPLAPSSLGSEELSVLQKEFDRVQILTNTHKSHK